MRRLFSLPLLLVCACGGPELEIDAQWVDEAGGPFSAGWSLQRSIEVTTAGPVTDGVVEAILQHPAPEELQVELRTANSPTVRLRAYVPAGGDDYRYTAPLYELQGAEGQGFWRLSVDARESDSPGVLHMWGLEL